MSLQPVQIDRERWSGEGGLTAALVERLAAIEQVHFIRVEDAPTDSAAASNFICNEIYVAFRVQRTLRMRTVFGILPLPTVGHRRSLTLTALERLLADTDGVGTADYADAGMLQYLRAERVVPAYQTRGPKVVEMVRIYEVG